MAAFAKCVNPKISRHFWMPTKQLFIALYILPTLFVFLVQFFSKISRAVISVDMEMVVEVSEYCDCSKYGVG